MRTVLAPRLKCVSDVVDIDAARLARRLLLSPSIEKPSAADLAAVISQSEHFAQDVGGGLYAYCNGVYRPNGAETVRRLAQQILKFNGRAQKWSSRLANETVEYLRVGAPQLWKRPPLDTLNLSDGLLDLQTRALRRHSPEFLSAVQLPVGYNPKALAVGWHKFINAVFPIDAVQAGLPWAIITWLMLPILRFQKALLLIGGGGTGKSTFLKLLSRFLGAENCSHLSLKEIEEDRFKPAQLIGKLLNTFADLPAGVLESTSIFKLIVGEDPISAERKYGQAFSFYPFARQCFSTNNFPIVKDASDAFFDRWLAVTFARKFRNTTEQREQDELMRELTAPEELSGVLNEALDALPQLFVRGFPTPPSSLAARSDLEAQSSPVPVWLMMNTTVTPDAWVTKGRLLEAYNANASVHGRLTMTAKGFSLELRKHFQESIGEKQKTINKKSGIWCWTGIRLLERATPVTSEVIQ
jgi:putative DNA primase/helicase